MSENRKTYSFNVPDKAALGKDTYKIDNNSGLWITALLVILGFVLIIVLKNSLYPSQDDNIIASIKQIENALNEKDEEKLFATFEFMLQNQLKSANFLTEYISDGNSEANGENEVNKDMQGDADNLDSDIAEIFNYEKVRFEVRRLEYSHSYRCEVFLLQTVTDADGKEKEEMRTFIMTREHDEWKLAKENFDG